MSPGEVAQADAIILAAQSEARLAISEGAVAPWGDGETLNNAGWTVLEEMLGRRPWETEIRLWDKAFRAEIERVG